MGVTGLWGVLEPVKKHRSIDSLGGETLAVDLSIWICEASVKQMQGQVVKPHLRTLFFRVSKLLASGIKLVFVLEGKAPELKFQTMTNRQQTRYGGNKTGKVSAPKRSHFMALVRECCEMLDYLGVPYIQAAGEAEAMCAYLNKQEMVDACITEDGDAFLYGAKTVYRNFTLDRKDPHIESYNMEDIELDLNLSQEKLVALSLFLGCDFIPKGVPGIGPKQASELIQSIHGKALPVLRSWKMKHNFQPHEFNCDKNIQKLFDSVRKKALQVEGFPSEEVISEFLVPKDKCTKLDSSLKRPQMVKFSAFTVQKMDWVGEYAIEKCLPLVTLWDMLNINKPGEHLVPLCITKTRIRQGVACYEVEWKKLDADKYTEKPVYTTIERQSLFAKSFSELQESFMNSISEKISKKKVKNKYLLDEDEIQPPRLQVPPAKSMSVIDALDLCLDNRDLSESLCRSPLPRTPRMKDSPSLDDSIVLSYIPLHERIKVLQREAGMKLESPIHFGSNRSAKIDNRDLLKRLDSVEKKIKVKSSWQKSKSGLKAMEDDISGSVDADVSILNLSDNDIDIAELSQKLENVSFQHAVTPVSKTLQYDDYLYQVEDSPCLHKADDFINYSERTSFGESQDTASVSQDSLKMWNLYDAIDNTKAANPCIEVKPRITLETNDGSIIDLVTPDVTINEEKDFEESLPSLHETLDLSADFMNLLLGSEQMERQDRDTSSVAYFNVDPPENDVQIISHYATIDKLFSSPSFNETVYISDKPSKTLQPSKLTKTELDDSIEFLLSQVSPCSVPKADRKTKKKSRKKCHHEKKSDSESCETKTKSLNLLKNLLVSGLEDSRNTDFCDGKVLNSLKSVSDQSLNSDVTDTSYESNNSPVISGANDLILIPDTDDDQSDNDVMELTDRI